MGAHSEADLAKKAARRVVPLLAALYFVSFLDRVNVGFGALSMNADLGLTPTTYGIGAGIFFVGYTAFAVPANFILRRIGASRWIATIAIAWGCVSLCMALVRTPMQFYAVRLLLGVAESGFLPGVILYLTTRFPRDVQGRVVANFFVAVPLSSVLGAPLSGVLLESHVMGLHGWQLMFIIEALPAIGLGLMALRHLPDSPHDASSLDQKPGGPLACGMRDGAQAVAVHSWQGLLSAPVWGLGLVYFLIVIALYGFTFWAPQIFLAAAELTPREIGVLTAIPYLGASVAMIVWSRHSDRRAERVWHLALPCALGALGFVLAGQVRGLPGITMAFLLATSGVYAACAVFWTLPRTFLGAAVATGIALLNAMGNTAGYLGPFMMGWLKMSTGGYVAGIRVMAASMVAAAALALTVGLWIERRGQQRGRSPAAR